MLQSPAFASSRPVVLLPYQPRWAEEFTALAGRLHALAEPWFQRLDHIGSTAVPGLAAKDVLDVQLTVADLTQIPPLLQALTGAGYQLRPGFQYDEFADLPADSLDLRKVYLREPAGQRRLHLHVREAGRFNTRFALLLRDYLRAEPAASRVYAQLKERAAALFPASIAGYLYLKEPGFYLLYQAATRWAEQTGWELPGDAR
ncbi:GrpB family protein [Hymenobacter sp. 102]|uniref:GrpB family protein n=1 Tax=Hymenobacter sp. 102 TaxID=3403152 RepID=UPI003CEA778B